MSGGNSSQGYRPFRGFSRVCQVESVTRFGLRCRFPSQTRQRTVPEGVRERKEDVRDKGLLEVLENFGNRDGVPTWKVEIRVSLYDLQSSNGERTRVFVLPLSRLKKKDHRGL